MAVDALARALAAGKVPVDAYEMAVAGGYTGTREQFETDMGNSATNATIAAEAAASVAGSTAQITQNTNDIAALDQVLDVTTAQLTKTGALVTFDGVTAGTNISRLSVDFEAVQSGSGTPSSANFRDIPALTSVSATRCGKNLFDKNNYTSLKVGYAGNTTDNQYTLDGMGTACAWIPLPGGVTYTVTCSTRTAERFAVFSSSEYPRTGGPMTKCVRDNSASSIVFAAPAGTKWIGFQLALSTGTVTSLATAVQGLQVEVGNTATEYAAYNGSAITTNFGSSLYSGSVDIISGAGTSNGGAVTLTGAASETWTKLGSGDNQYFRIKLGDAGTIRTDWCLATVLPMAEGELLSSNTYVGVRVQEVSSDSHNIYVCVRPENPSQFAGPNAFKAWLADLNTNSKPFKVVYKYTTGTAINDTAVQASAAAGTNNFIHDGEQITVTVDGSISSGALDAKQDLLTFDNTPVEGSANPVTSGGVYDAIEEVVDNSVSLETLHVKRLMPQWTLGNVTSTGSTNLSAGYAHTTEMIESPYVLVRVTDTGDQYGAYINRVALYDNTGKFIASNPGAGSVHNTEVYTLDTIAGLSPDNQVRVSTVKVAVYISTELINANVSDVEITELVNSCFTVKCIPVGADDDAVNADVPENEGVYNTLLNAWQQTQIQFTTTAGFPQQAATNRLYPEGTTVTGLPYSATRSTMNHIPEYVTFESFMTAVADPNSYLYTRKEATSNGLTYYGSICHVFCRYALNVLHLYSATAWDGIPGMELVQPQSHQSLKLGDMIVVNTSALTGHVVMITGILRDMKGRIKSVTVSESGGKGCHSATLTIDSLMNSYPLTGNLPNTSGLVYDIYRYSLISQVRHTQIPYVAVGDEASQTHTVNPNLGLRKGNRSNWLTDETVEIDVMDNNSGIYTGYEIKKYGIPVYDKQMLFKSGGIGATDSNMGTVISKNDGIRNYRSFALSEYPTLHIKSDGTLKFTVFSYRSATMNSTYCLNDTSTNAPYQTTAYDFTINSSLLVSGATHFAMMVEMAEPDGIVRRVDYWKDLLLSRMDMFTAAPTTTTGSISSLSTAAGTRVDGTTVAPFKVISLSGLTAGSYRARLTGSGNAASGWVDWMMVSLVETIVNDPNVTGGVTVDVECSNNAVPMVVQWASSNSIQNLSRTVVEDYTRGSSTTTAHLTSVYAGFDSSKNPYGIRNLVSTEYGVICRAFAWNPSATPPYDTNDHRWVTVT